MSCSFPPCGDGRRWHSISETQDAICEQRWAHVLRYRPVTDKLKRRAQGHLERRLGCLVSAALTFAIQKVVRIVARRLSKAQIAT
jgi:hypothetical protein